MTDRVANGGFFLAQSDFGKLVRNDSGLASDRVESPSANDTFKTWEHFININSTSTIYKLYICVNLSLLKVLCYLELTLKVKGKGTTDTCLWPVIGPQ